MGSTSLLGFSYPNLLLVFLKILSKKLRFLYKIFVQDFVPIRIALRGGGIASFSLILFFYLLYWYYSYIVYFVCAPASEFGAMGSTSFLGFSYPNLLLVFLNLLFFRNLIIFFSQQVLGLYLGLFYFIVIFLYHILG